MLQDPHTAWTYRGIECQLYKYTMPDGFRWTGYAKFGDEWLELVDTENEDDASSVQNSMETRIDLKLTKLFDDEDDESSVPQPVPGTGRDPYEPWDPDPSPDDWPNYPWEPDVIWSDDADTCEACEQLASAGHTGEPPKCPRHRELPGATVYWGSTVSPLPSETWG